MLIKVIPDTVKYKAPFDMPGLTLRNWRDESDYERMLRVLYADKHSQGLEEAISVEDLKAHLESMPNNDVRTGVFLLEHEGEVIAYKNLRGYAEASGVYCYNHHGYVLPEWKERGIGRAMIRHSEQVLREIAAVHPPEAEKFFQVFIDERATALSNLLTQEGYSPARYFYEMLRPNLDNIPDAQLPPGIEVRPVQPDQMRKIWQAAIEAFKEHWGETNHTEEDYERWLKRPFIQPEWWHIAWAGDRVAALVTNYVDEADNVAYNRRRGQTEDIGTLKEFRGQGIAAALIARGPEQFKKAGFTEASLGVDSENGSGALRLYEKMGYRPHGTLVVYRKPLLPKS